jgi:uncharacterized protein YecE (DUF72 family)
MAKIWIGTSGWSYRDWVGVFYPRAMKPADHLAHYARHFDIVEINSTFYRLPSPETLKGWRAVAPDHFVFACKASRYITHMKKLRDPEQSLSSFVERVSLLGDQLGPILFQLPPRWRANPDRLEQFLLSLPKPGRYAFEFRDATWFDQAIRDLLAEHNAAFCIYDLAGECSPLSVTADFTYLRLHGPDGPYCGSYSDDALTGWAERLIAWRGEGFDAYCFFDNDEKGYAVLNARRLAAMVNALSCSPFQVAGVDDDGLASKRSNMAAAGQSRRRGR